MIQNAVSWLVFQALTHHPIACLLPLASCSCRPKLDNSKLLSHPRLHHVPSSDAPALLDWSPSLSVQGRYGTLARLFFVLALCWWSELPLGVQTAQSLVVFMWCLKTYLFLMYLKSHFSVHFVLVFSLMVSLVYELVNQYGCIHWLRLKKHFYLDKDIRQMV